MENRELAFSTFLKLLELAEHQKASTLRGFMRGGGFNYWRPLQNLAPDIVNGNLDLLGIQNKVGASAKGHQRKYNEHALTNLLKWVGRRTISPRTQPNKLVVKFGNSGLKVRLNPEVAFAMGGHSYLMHIWATNNPTLTEETLSMGLYFFRHYYRKVGGNDVQFLIFDTVKDRIFAEFNVLDSANDMLIEQRAILSSMWSEISSGTGAPSTPPTTSEYQEDQPHV